MSAWCFTSAVDHVAAFLHIDHPVFQARVRSRLTNNSRAVSHKEPIWIWFQNMILFTQLKCIKYEIDCVEFMHAWVFLIMQLLDHYHPVFMSCNLVTCLEKLHLCKATPPPPPHPHSHTRTQFPSTSLIWRINLINFTRARDVNNLNIPKLFSCRGVRRVGGSYLSVCWSGRKFHLIGFWCALLSWHPDPILTHELMCTCGSVCVRVPV